MYHLYFGEHVAVPRMCLFTTASGFQVSSNNNNDLYKAAIHSAGEHLNTGCDQFVIDSNRLYNHS